MSTATVTKEVLEALQLFDGTTARVTQQIIEALIPSVSRSPTTITGAGVTKETIEAAIGGSPRAVLSQVVVEAAIIDNSTAGQPGVGPNQTISYGFSV